MTAFIRALSYLAILLFAGPVAAELVVLSDGDFLKVEAFRLIERGYELELPSGGLLVLPRSRVARIVDDEIVPPEQRAPVVPTPPSFSLRFAAQAVPAVPHGELIHAAAERHGLNPQLVAAVVSAESAYRIDALSHKGAQGLMQLMPATAERFGLRGDEVYDAAKNLDAGCRYLRWLADRFEDELALVLAGYNAGEGAVDRHGGVPPYRETRNYVAKITARLGLDPAARGAS